MQETDASQMTFEEWFKQLKKYAEKQYCSRLIDDNDAESYKEYYLDGDSPQSTFDQEAKAKPCWE